MEYITDTERFSLIKGEFTKEEARDILLGMINYKINFHEVRNFGSSIQQGRQDDLSITRIHELEETRNQMLKFFSELEDSGKLKITSKIIIERVQ
jgi:hypothetical protein